MAAAPTTLRAIRPYAALLMAGACLAACATPQPRYAARPPIAQPPKASPPGAPTPGYKVGQPYQIGGVWYVPREQPDYDEVGIASWYGPGFHMKTTANGEIFDQHQLTAAHTTLPLPSWVEVTNLENGRRMQLRVNDRGPFVGGRIIDLSQAAARELGFEQKGTARVRVRYVGPAPLPQDAGWRYAAAPAAGPRAPAVPPPPAPAPATPAQDELWSSPRTVSRPSAVSAEELRPLGTAAAPAVTPVSNPLPAAAGPYRVQAGAFINWDNARKAADAIEAAGLGRTKLEPIYRDTGNIYRVMVDAPGEEGQAQFLREQVAALGYPDARVIRP